MKHFIPCLIFNALVICNVVADDSEFRKSPNTLLDQAINVSQAALAPQSALTPQSTQPSLSKNTVTACGHHDYPPWNWKKGNQIVGACAEVTSLLFKSLGLQVSHKFIGPWKRCQSAIKTGKVDVNICAFINDQRKQYSIFINTPMGHNTTSVFVPKDKEFPFETWQDIEDRRVVMVRGVSMGQDFDSFLKSLSTVERVNNRKQAFHFLSLGRADLLATGHHIGILQRNLYGFKDKISVLPVHIQQGNLHFSMSKKSKFIKLLPDFEA